jgi:hypothetical protein
MGAFDSEGQAERSPAAAFVLAGAASKRRSRLSARAHRHERQMKTAWITVAFTLFIVLVAAALWARGRITLGPMQELAAGVVGGGTNQIGDVLLAMPDGTFCRRLEFNNETAELGGGNVERCPEKRAGRHGPLGFAWGAR